MPDKKRDLIIAAVLLAFCVFWAVQTGEIRDQTVPGTPGPRYFPYLIIGAMAVMAVLLAFSSVRAILKERGIERATLQRRSAAAEEAQGCEDPGGEKPRPLRIASVFVTLFVYAIAIQWIGFFVATAAACVFILRIIMRTNDWKMILFSTAVITGGIFVVFRIAIPISLPSGILL